MKSTRGTLRLAGDAVAAVLALWIAFVLRIEVPLPFTRGLLPQDRTHFFSQEWLVVLVLQFSALYFLGFYDPPRPRSALETLRRLALASFLQAMGLIAIWFAVNSAFPRSVLLLYVALNAVLLFGWRRLIDRIGGRETRRVAIVGSGAAARELATALQASRWYGLEVVGYALRPGDAMPEGPGTEALGPCLGPADGLAQRLAEGEMDDLIIAGSADTWQARLIDSLAHTRPDHSNVLLLPGPFESLIGRMRYRWVQDLPLIEVVRESEWRNNRPLKRSLDLVGGTVLLLASLPVMAVVALAIRVSSPGPVLYRQTRVGRVRKPFILVKFRTMRPDAEAESGEVLAQPGDARLTSIGAFLRRYRLDELPQVLNVLSGSMSLVGPRPERPGFVQTYLREVPGYAERFSVAPGLTGLAQVNGDYHSSPQNKLRYELAYISNWSLWLDVSILLRTVKIVLTSRGV